MPITVSFTLELEIVDAEAFAAAARERALAEGLSGNDAAKYTANDLAACAVMLADPGVSPIGAKILDSSAEIHTHAPH